MVTVITSSFSSLPFSSFPGFRDKLLDLFLLYKYYHKFSSNHHSSLFFHSSPLAKMTILATPLSQPRLYRYHIKRTNLPKSPSFPSTPGPSGFMVCFAFFYIFLFLLCPFSATATTTNYRTKLPVTPTFQADGRQVSWLTYSFRSGTV